MTWRVWYGPAVWRWPMAMADSGTPGTAPGHGLRPTFGITLMLHPENQGWPRGYAHDGRIPPAVCWHTEVAETTAVMEMLLLAEETAAAPGPDILGPQRAMIAEARDRGVDVTADVAMHQLLLTEDALSGFDSRFHVRPPLRSEADRQALLEGIRSGAIDAIVMLTNPTIPQPAGTPGGDRAGPVQRGKRVVDGADAGRTSGTEPVGVAGKTDCRPRLFCRGRPGGGRGSDLRVRPDEHWLHAPRWSPDTMYRFLTGICPVCSPYPGGGQNRVALRFALADAGGKASMDVYPVTLSSFLLKRP